jgi:hypothetical protein
MLKKTQKTGPLCIIFDIVSEEWISFKVCLCIEYTYSGFERENLQLKGISKTLCYLMLKKPSYVVEGVAHSHSQFRSQFSVSTFSLGAPRLWIHKGKTY